MEATTDRTSRSSSTLSCRSGQLLTLHIRLWQSPHQFGRLEESIPALVPAAVPGGLAVINMVATGSVSPTLCDGLDIPPFVEALVSP